MPNTESNTRMLLAHATLTAPTQLLSERITKTLSEGYGSVRDLVRMLVRQDERYALMEALSHEGRRIIEFWHGSSGKK